ncbi:MAG: GDP-L-fucose synthase [Planctomycetota bacterium]|nr:MAG: GDP-L-fucose synthase [Planctomycetota bacterium]
MRPDSRIFVAGHRGMVGSAIVRRLLAEGASRLLLRSRSELDLTDQAAVEAFFAAEKPEYVFLAAAKVGGIRANNAYPAEFLRDNLAIQTNVIHSAWKHGAAKLCFLGSSCIYPKLAPQPLREEYLLTGPLEPTNEWYAVAKIAGIKMCQAYRRQYRFDAISLMPTNLYGPGDNFHPENSHVLPALIRRFHEAHSGEQFVNVGTGTDLTILELAQLVADVVGFTGAIVTDPSKPDGTPRKLLDVSRLEAMGWKARIGLREGVAGAYAWYLENAATARG